MNVSQVPSISFPTDEHSVFQKESYHRELNAYISLPNYMGDQAFTTISHIQEGRSFLRHMLYRTHGE